MAVLQDFAPPPVPADPLEGLFADEVEWFVQTTIESSDSKKKSGSSDAAHTYDTLAT